MFPTTPKAHAMQLGWPEFVLATSMPHRHVKPTNTLKLPEAARSKVGPHLRNIPGRCRAAMNAPCHLTAQHLVRVRGRKVANAFDDESLLGAKDLHCLGE